MTRNNRRPLKRIYHHYEDWECFKRGMYIERKGGDRAVKIELAYNLLRDPPRLKHRMERVAREWFYSCRQHMSSRNMNRQAYLGQAACCHAHRASESETREAWRLLSDDEREAANAVADEVILLWEGWHFEYEDRIRNRRTDSRTTTD